MNQNFLDRLPPKQTVITIIVFILLSEFFVSILQAATRESGFIPVFIRIILSYALMYYLYSGVKYLNYLTAGLLAAGFANALPMLFDSTVHGFFYYLFFFVLAGAQLVSAAILAFSKPVQEFLYSDQ